MNMDMPPVVAVDPVALGIWAESAARTTSSQTDFVVDEILRMLARERRPDVEVGDSIHLFLTVVGRSSCGAPLVEFPHPDGPVLIAVDRAGVVAVKKIGIGDRVEVAPHTVGTVKAISGDEAWVEHPKGEGFLDDHGTYKLASLKRA